MVCYFHLLMLDGCNKQEYMNHDALRYLPELSDPEGKEDNERRVTVVG